MISIAGYTLAGLIAVAIIAIGARFIAAPASPPPATACRPTRTSHRCAPI